MVILRSPMKTLISIEFQLISLVMICIPILYPIKETFIDPTFFLIRLPSGEPTVCYGQSPSLSSVNQRTKWVMFQFVM